MALVHVGAPIRPNVGTDVPADRADHARAERADSRFVGQPIGIHRRAVMTATRAAIDQQVTATVRTDMREGNGLETLGSMWGHFQPVYRPARGPSSGAYARPSSYRR